jgi:hypothetical protein
MARPYGAYERPVAARPNVSRAWTRQRQTKGRLAHIIPVSGVVAQIVLRWRLPGFIGKLLLVAVSPVWVIAAIKNDDTAAGILTTTRKLPV